MHTLHATADTTPHHHCLPIPLFLQVQGVRRLPGGVSVIKNRVTYYHLIIPLPSIFPPREYADFRVGSDGEVQGVGLLIASDPSSGRLVVLSPISGSPAERAGILPGDQVRVHYTSWWWPGGWLLILLDGQVLQAVVGGWAGN